MSVLVCLMPHDWHQYALHTPDHIDPQEHIPVRIVPASGVVARVRYERGGTVDEDGVPTATLIPAGVDNLPPWQAGVLLIVSLAVAQAAGPGRFDLRVNDGYIRHIDSGREVGARGLGHLVWPREGDPR